LYRGRNQTSTNQPTREGQMKVIREITSLVLLGILPAVISAQSSGTVTQVVSKRNTIGVLAATPATGVTVGSTVNFSYQLFTAGAPAPTTETVQFNDGASPLGTPVTITQVAASNLLPYSQVNLSKGWTATGTAATATPLAVVGADGSANTATNIAFPDTTAGSSGVTLAVPSSTNYANQPVTLSFYAKSATNTTLTMQLTDSPQKSASNSNTCAVTSTWQRCTLTYTFPVGAGTGFAASIISSGNPAASVSVWGVQVEQAGQAGPYVSTIGTARPTGAQAGMANFSWSAFLEGNHPISVAYTGDANFEASASNAVMLAVDKGTAAVVLTDSPAGSSVYGVAVTLTAAVTGANTTPSGTVQFMDGATSLGSGTLDGSGHATLTLTGPTSLPTGSHSITAVYSGDTNFNGVTSSAITHVVTQAPSTVITTTVTSSLNPSVYGNSVVINVNVASSVGIQPTGTVSVTDGATSLGTITLDASGNGSLTIPLFTAGSHSIVATYSGDGNYGN
jgi:hypothetical protein